MKKLIVLLLIFCSLPAYSATKKKITVPTNSAVLSSSNSSYLSQGSLWVTGDNISSYIDRVGSRTPVGNIVPTKRVPTSKIVASLKSLMKLSPASIATSAALVQALTAMDWVFDNSTAQFKVSDGLHSPIAPGATITTGGTSGTDCYTAAGKSGVVIPAGAGPSTYVFWYQNQPVGNFPPPWNYVNNCGAVKVGITQYSNLNATLSERLATETDIDQLDFTDYDSDFYRGILRDSCQASTNPNACFDSMVDQSLLSGPSSVIGPKSKTTTYQTNSDGTTSTVETTTSTQYDLEYGEDYFTYNPKTTSETKIDGAPTSTTVTEEDPAVSEEEKPAEEEKPESAIAGMNCNATVACSGDAIQCAMASTQKDTKCILEQLATIDETELTTTVSNQFAGADYQPFSPEETTMVDLSSYIDTSSRIAASCPVIPPINITIAGNTSTFDFAQWLSILCEYASWFGVLLVVFSLRNGVEVIARGFG